MYELIILAQLMRRPGHGYLIAKIINDVIGPYARVSNGRLYPLLAKLQMAGLIDFDVQEVSEHHGERHSRRYRITDAGKARFHALMMDTTSNPGDYREIFLQKVPFLDFLKPIERQHLIDHYINYCQAHVLHLASEAHDIVEQHPSWDYGSDDKAFVEDVVTIVQHMIDRWRLDLDWAEKLRKQKLTSLQRSGCPHYEDDNNNINDNRNEN